ncbi:PEGA domain-containing protein [Sandaracinus amylolyticus]|uniref:PEGA domain-containing protein n=1 Tax=Sandaracinus amylolyticus TaxID=927083 RepID=UPI001F1A1B1F|nr:tetratricopeptide repeat protein [Sandaracinus amylolyticus]UJR80344.1 Thiol-disulfide isomerase [Sandaracinus amylolyticus]
MRPALVALVILALPSALSAQETPQPPHDATVAEQDADVARRARAAFEAGVAHFEARRYRDAIHEFQVAAQLVPSADLWFNVARAHEELGEWEQAIEHYRRYLRDRVDPPDRAQVEGHIRELEERAEAARAARLTRPTTGTLTVRVDVEGATVRVGDREVGQSPIGDELSLDPGRHPLLVTREGYLPFRSEVAVEAGLRTAAYVDLQPETRYRAIEGERIFTWIAWGLSAASLGVAIGLGVEAGSRQGSDLDSAREWSAWSDAALGAAIGFGALGAILWFLEGRAVGTEVIPPPSE